MIPFLVILIYLSFVLDFLVFPIPSEASTPAILNRADKRFSVDNVLLRLTHLGLLALWAFPLVIACLVLLGSAPASGAKWLAWSGLAIALGGRAITLLASHIIRQATPDSVVSHSVFAFSRHPIVLGLHLTLAGLLCSTGSLLALALFPATVIYFDKKVRIEEDALVARFGDDYRRYADTTPRYLQLPGSGPR